MVQLSGKLAGMKDEGSIFDPFSFRPPQELAARFGVLCEQLGYRKAQALASCLQAVLEMVDAPEPQVPRLVTMLRTLREQRATLQDDPRAFGPTPIRHAVPVEIAAVGADIIPFRAVQPPADHVLVPLYGSIAAGFPGSEGGQPVQPLEYLTLLTSRARGGQFALRVAGHSMNRCEEGIQDGDIVLLADPSTRRPQSGDIVAALVDGETCLKRFCQRKGGGTYLQSESDNPAFGKIYPARELVIQGVFVGKV